MRVPLLAVVFSLLLLNGFVLGASNSLTYRLGVCCKGVAIHAHHSSDSLNGSLESHILDQKVMDPLIDNNRMSNNKMSKLLSQTSVDANLDDEDL